MNILSRRSMFVIAGLVVVAVTFFLTRSSVEASKKEGKKFEDWIVSCTTISNEDKKKKTCFLNQQINISQDDKQQALAVYQIGYFADELKMLQILPLNINVEAGTSIISSKNMIAKGKFTTCTVSSCNAIANISDEELKNVLSTKENSVAFMNIEGKLVHLPISVKGLEKGLAYLRK